jgi:hypothetical protein
MHSHGRLRHLDIEVTTSGGGDDTSTGSGDSEIVVVGDIEMVHLAYTSAADNPDVTLKTKGDGPPSYNILVVSNAKTDADFYPRAKPVDSANAAITDAHAPFVVADKLTLDLAQFDVGDVVKATIYFRR